MSSNLTTIQPKPQTRLIGTWGPIKRNWVTQCSPRAINNIITTPSRTLHDLYKVVKKNSREKHVSMKFSVLGLVFKTSALKFCSMHALKVLPLEKFLLFSLWSHLGFRCTTWRKTALIVFCNSAVLAAARGGWLLHLSHSLSALSTLKRGSPKVAKQLGLHIGFLESLKG